MTIERRTAETSPERKTRTLYLQQLVGRYLQEMRLLFRGGRLTKREQWRNVAEHCVVQLAAAEVLADLLHLSDEDRRKLCSVAAVHNWDKRIEVGNRQLKDMAEVTERERLQAEIAELESRAREFLEAVDPDLDLLRATGVKFLHRALIKGEATFLEKVQFYLDDICGDLKLESGRTVTDIMPLRQRIAEVAGRRQDLTKDAELTALLGGPYWNRELELGEAVERELWEHMGGAASGIPTPEDIPAFLRAELMRRIEAFAPQQ